MNRNEIIYIDKPFLFLFALLFIPPSLFLYDFSYISQWLTFSKIDSIQFHPTLPNTIDCNKSNISYFPQILESLYTNSFSSPLYENEFPNISADTAKQQAVK